MPHQHVLEFAALSDAGKVRSHNEDAIVVCADYGCAVLADGMGGYQAGEVASAMTVQIVAEQLCTRLDARWRPRLKSRLATMAGWMVSAIEEANQQVLAMSNSNPDCFGMGTTVVASACVEDKILFAHIGDSRAYVLREGRLSMLTHDHSVLQEQLDAGYISVEEARSSSIKNLITRAVGTQAAVEVEVSMFQMRENDLYMLCSDGLTDMLSHDEIEGILNSSARDLALTCKSLVDGANGRGGMDNISVVLFRTQVPPPPSWVRRILTK